MRACRWLAQHTRIYIYYLHYGCSNAVRTIIVNQIIGNCIIVHSYVYHYECICSVPVCEYVLINLRKSCTVLTICARVLCACACVRVCLMQCRIAVIINRGNNNNNNLFKIVTLRRAATRFSTALTSERSVWTSIRGRHGVAIGDGELGRKLPPGAIILWNINGRYRTGCRVVLFYYWSHIKVKELNSAFGDYNAWAYEWLFKKKNIYIYMYTLKQRIKTTRNVWSFNYLDDREFWKHWIHWIGRVRIPRTLLRYDVMYAVAYLEGCWGRFTPPLKFIFVDELQKSEIVIKLN